ncbi:MAG: DUF975 family protein [Lutibacter sp.]|jgi:uncharacterized membrane protein|nr:DUF975 family protein [Lutibacter sp.]
MLQTNAALTAAARDSLSERWGLAIGVFFVYFMTLVAISLIPVAGSILQLIIAGPLGLGVAIFSKAIARKEAADIDQLFQGFQQFGRALVSYLLMTLFVFLGMLLLIIPGIILALAYSQVFYILSDDETISPMEALNKSKEMMQGYKWKYFLLALRFLGWFLLCILTLGIGLLWLMPYVQVSYATFYEALKKQSATVV